MHTTRTRFEYTLSATKSLFYGPGSVDNHKTHTANTTLTNPLKTHKFCIILLAAAKGTIAMIGCGSDIVDRHTQSLASQRPVLL